MPSVHVKWSLKFDDLRKTEKLVYPEILRISSGFLHYEFLLGIANQPLSTIPDTICTKLKPYITCKGCNTRFDAVPCTVNLWEYQNTLQVQFYPKARCYYLKTDIIELLRDRTKTVDITLTIEDEYFKSMSFGQLSGNRAATGGQAPSLNLKLFEKIFDDNESIRAFIADQSGGEDSLVLDCPDNVLLQSGDGKYFQCSRTILALQSPVFEAMFRTTHNDQGQGNITGFQECRSKVVNIPDVDSPALTEFLRSIYMDVVDLKKSENIIDELLYVAEKYETTKLRQYCLYMMGTTISFENAARWFDASQMYNCQNLEKFTVDYVCKNLFAIQKDQPECWQQLQTRSEFMKKVLACMSKFYVAGPSRD